MTATPETPAIEPDDWCPAEYPDPDNLGFIGHRCVLPPNHPEEEHVTVVQIGRRDVTLRWAGGAA